jgi:hypothetical protein
MENGNSKLENRGMENRKMEVRAAVTAAVEWRRSVVVLRGDLSG